MSGKSQDVLLIAGIEAELEMIPASSANSLGNSVSSEETEYTGWKFDFRGHDEGDRINEDGIILPLPDYAERSA
jgi:hypothetical protein